MIEEGLIPFILADAGLSALIGTRLHDDVLPQSPTLPALVWQRISTPREYSQSGSSHYAMPRFQFACWANTRLETLQVADALRTALEAYKGAMGSEIVYGIFVENELSGYDPDTGLRRQIVDYRIDHKEA